MGSVLRPIALSSAFVVGYFFPQIALLSGAIPWFVRLMLLTVFLRIEFGKMRLRPSHFWILALNIVVAVAAFGALNLLGERDLATAAFFAGIAPTATAAPAVATFLKRDSEYVVAGLLLTTFGVAVALPALLPRVLGEATPGAFWRVAGNVASVVVAPIVVAQIVRRIYPDSPRLSARLKNLTFACWVAMVTIIAAKATAFIKAPENGVSPTILLEIGAVSLVVCAFNFGAGRLVGEKDCRAEASQTLGQKNTGVAIYFATLYANPLVALGPTLYVFWHNFWNAIQLEILAIRERRAAKSAADAVSSAKVGSAK